MKIKDGFILRQVADTYIVVAVGQAVKSFNGIINLNETGAFLWKFFAEEHTLNEGVAALLGEYDVDEALAREEVEKFLETIERHGFTE